MSSTSPTYQIVLNITTSKRITSASYRTSTTSTSYTLPSTYPSIPHANAAVQRDLKAWVAEQPQHLRMKMQSFTEDGTWEFEFMGKDENEEVLVEAVFEKNEDKDAEMDVDDNDIEMGGNGEKVKQKEKRGGKGKDKNGKTSKERGRSRQRSTRTRSTAEDGRVEENVVVGARAVRRMSRRRAKGRDGEGEDEG